MPDETAGSAELRERLRTAEESLRAAEDRILTLETALSKVEDRHDEFRQEMKTEVQSLRATIQDIKTQIASVMQTMTDTNASLKTIEKKLDAAQDERAERDKSQKTMFWVAATFGPYILAALIAIGAYLKAHL